MSHEDDEQFNQVGEHIGISTKGINNINDIKDNNYLLKDFKLQPSDAGKFTNLSWRLLGRYIANNNYLERVDLVRCSISDEKMASLFYELTYSSSLTHLHLCHNSFGVDGLRSMVPFLNDTNLLYLNFFNNN